MIINVIAALPGAASVGTAATGTGENSGFASVLGDQLAAAIDRLAPVMQGDKEREASDKLNEEEADAVWLTPAGLMDAVVPAALTEAVAASLPTADLTKAVTVPQMSRPGSGSAHGMLTIDPEASPESVAAQTGRAADEMLRMIASPQAGKPAEAQMPQNTEPTVSVKPAISAALGLQAERDQAVQPVDNRLPAMPLTVAHAFSPASLATPAPAAVTSAANVMQPVAHGMLEPEVGSPAWSQALGQKLSSFTRNGIHHAELRLHPEHLGPLQVKLRLNQDQVQLHFVTDQQPVRAALEAAMPHLRTSLAEAGIQLDQGSVGRDGSAWDSSGDPHSGQSSHSRQEADGASLIEVEEDIAPQPIHSRMGISIFA